MRAAVIGSGPAGVAAAHALAEAGCAVTVIDAGGEAGPAALAPFRSLATTEPDQWPAATVRRLRGSFSVGVKSYSGLKPAYGSLFPYAIDDDDLSVSNTNTAALASLARGGLSNTWGAAMLPFRQRDIADWPISLAELVPHYESVLRFVPLAGEHDRLESMYPLYGEPQPLSRTPQTDHVLDRWNRRAGALAERGFSFGRARLAVRSGDADPRRCRYAGLCMYGCPYESIYNAAQTLTELLERDAVTYRSGVYVDRITEHGDTVRIDTHARGGSGRAEFDADRVFVAAGAVSSTRLILESLNAQISRRLVDSEFFMFPVLTGRSAPIGTAIQGNTLAQVFLELEDEAISRHTVHLQLYPYNDLMAAALAATIPLPPEVLERLFAPLLGRMVVLQGYLHSRDSPGLTLTPTRDGVRLIGDRAASAVNRVARRLAADTRLLEMSPIPGLLQPGTPGKSNHLGGSLPMRTNPGPFESDLLGRPHGLERVHVVDAAVLPSIPASTVTLSVMANAHRIAVEATRAHRREASAD